MKKLYKKKIITPIGVMIAMATDEAICLLDFFDSKTLLIDQTIVMQHFKVTDDEEKDTPLLLELAHQLNEYLLRKKGIYAPYRAYWYFFSGRSVESTTNNTLWRNSYL